MACCRLGLYTGTHVLNASHLDRWTTVFSMSYLPEEREESLLLTKVPSLDQKMAKALVKLANAVRRAAEQEPPPGLRKHGHRGPAR